MRARICAQISPPFELDVTRYFVGFSLGAIKVFLFSIATRASARITKNVHGFLQLACLVLHTRSTTETSRSKVHMYCYKQCFGGPLGHRMPSTHGRITGYNANLRVRYQTRTRALSCVAPKKHDASAITKDTNGPNIRSISASIAGFIFSNALAISVIFWRHLRISRSRVSNSLLNEALC